MDANYYYNQVLQQLLQKAKRRVFVSYFHKDDESYRDKFEQYFGDIFQNISVKPGEINDNNSDDYIAQVIRQEKISKATVIVVLIGNRTYCRKHVDWEIAAGLDPRVGEKRAGLVGILLPSSSLYNMYNMDIIDWLNKKKNEEIDEKDRNIYTVTNELNNILDTRYHKLPPRLLDNILSGYSKIYKWTTDKEQMKKIIEGAFSMRDYEKLVKNRRLKYRNNICGD
jgi:hypothetical protein